MPLYSVGIFNRKVRELVEEGSHHRNLDDRWADIHYIEIKASSLEAAERKVKASHPADMGYIIESIQESF